jgi:hypothetical protein
MLVKTSDPTQRINIQHAAWYVTDPSYGLTPGAQAELNIALNNYQSQAFQSTLGYYEIISDISLGRGREQEFIVEDAPEPRSLAMIGAGLLLVTGVLKKIALQRKKQS